VHRFFNHSGKWKSPRRGPLTSGGKIGSLFPLAARACREWSNRQ
jgi:hypothetical protein